MKHIFGQDYAIREPEDHPRFRWKNFIELVTIKINGPPGFGADIDVEVEFAAYPGDTETRELVSIMWPIYEVGTRRVIDRKPFPDFFIPYLRDCVDLNALETDF